MAKISLEEVKRLAGLSALQFDEDELVAFQSDFEKILEFVDDIQSADISKVQVKYNTHNMNELREDEIKDSITQEEVLLNSPKTKKGAFCVPKMIGE